jgi:3-oxoacyl-[acyl-carrier protein] reductase
MPPRADLLSLAGRTVLVTGAARGIGAATALAMARAGAGVALFDRDAAGLERTAGEIGAAGGEAMAARGDVTDASSVKKAVTAAIDRWQRLDVLVNNAGILRDATLGKVSDEDWALTHDVNLRGAMVCAREVLPHMLAAGSGRILSATSMVARSGNYGQTSYASSKAGIVGLTRTWARELGPKGITANAVAPGFIDTEMARSVPPKVMAAAILRTPAGRLGRPEEVANVYVFLASDLATFINGAVVGVDGGILL